MLTTYFNFNDLNAEALSFKYNKISSKVLEVKEEEIDISQLINYKTDILNSMINKIFPDQVDSFRVRDNLMSKIKQDYNEKFKKKLQQYDEKGFTILKLNISISRASILGFAIGDIVINDVDIKHDLNNIMTDMNNALDRLDNILSYFTIEKKGQDISYYPIDPIWDPEQYKDIPKLLKEKPKDMPQEEYDRIRSQNLSVLRGIAEINLLNWIKSKIEDDLNISKDNQDKNPTMPKITIETKGSSIYTSNFNERLRVYLLITFKLGIVTLQVETGYFYLYNEEV